jgi:hypothetical protein
MIFLQIEKNFRSGTKTFLICAMIFFEIVCIVSGSTALRVLGIKVFGRWIYSAVHGLVWVKWSIGSYLLGQYSPDYEGQYSPAYDKSAGWWTSRAMYMYSSAFMLNAVLTGVRAQWDYL